MSNELEKSNSGVNKSQSTVRKISLGQALLESAGAALTKMELPRMFNQLVIFLLDGSGSMTFAGTSGRSKGYEVHQAVINVLERLQASKNKSSFDVAFWAFANETVEMFPIKAAKDCNLTKDCFNPCEFISDYSKTLLSDPLTNAKAQIESYFEKYKDQNTKVLVVVLGDGAINDYTSAFKLKEELCKNPCVTFSSILFESPHWVEEHEAKLIEKVKNDFAKLASSNADYMSTVDPGKIRDHMIQSITKISKI